MQSVCALNIIRARDEKAGVGDRVGDSSSRLAERFRNEGNPTLGGVGARSSAFERLRLGAGRRRKVRDYFRFSTFEVSKFCEGNFSSGGAGTRRAAAFPRCVLDFSDLLNGLNPRTAKKETSEAKLSSARREKAGEILVSAFILATVFGLSLFGFLSGEPRRRDDFRVLLLSSAFWTTRRDLIRPSISSAGFFISRARTPEECERRVCRFCRFCVLKSVGKNVAGEKRAAPLAKEKSGCRMNGRRNFKTGRPRSKIGGPR